MPARPPEPAHTSLGARLTAARTRAFVGRTAEVELVRSALVADLPPFSVLWLHGPGGVGKTTLLRRLIEEAEALGAPARLVDCRTVEATPRGFTEALGEQGWPPGVRLLLVDTAEALGGLESWLREEFLPRAPGQALTVVASRREPEPGWAADAAWSEALRVVSVRNLRPDEAQALLRRRQVPEAEVPGVLAFTHGHPLALALVADVVAQRRGDGRPWRVEESPDVVAALLAHLIEELPTGRHRDALDVLTLARVTTENLLRHALPELDPGTAPGEERRLFDWLRQLSFVSTSPEGLVPHDTARETLAADLRWRDRRRYTTVHRAVRKPTAARLLDPAGPDRRAAMADLLYLHRFGRIMRDFYDWDALPAAWADRPLPADREQVLAMVERHEGPQAARLAGAWWAAQPRAFTVFRRGAGQVDGFMALIDVSPQDPGLPDDPVTAAALGWAARHAPLRPGEHLNIGRWWMDAERYQVPGTTMNLVASVSTPRWVADPGLGLSLVYARDGDFWAPMFSFIDLNPFPAASAEVGGRTYTAFGHDWRTVPPVAWLDLMEQRELTEELTVEELTPAVPPLALSQPDFAEAVKHAFRCYPRPELLSRSALVRSRLVGQDRGPDALRAVLAEAVRALADDPRGAHLGRLLEVTYVKGAGTQEAAAARLGLPFSTYRRHLAAALECVTGRLWERELYGARPGQASGVGG
jgi:hypothetical protein